MPSFRMPSIPPTTCKSIRFPNDMIEKVEAMIQGNHCSFSAFVIEAVRLALETISENEKDGENTAS